MKLASQIQRRAGLTGHCRLLLRGVVGVGAVLEAVCGGLDVKRDSWSAVVGLRVVE